MRQITSLMLAMLFVSSTLLYAQQHSTGLAKQNGELDQFKMEQMLQPAGEKAPGTYPGNEVIATDADYDLQFEYPVGVGGGEAGIETDGT
ncbi:MAG: hypothetical protein EOM23_05705, partial [Candidatus Moranbacteria bacterium]|nr:hypothetical protein [Candidatus Moranbacteria bacterium]